MKLHLGCGSNNLPGAINIDCVETKATNLVMDLKQKLPYEDNSVEYIWTEHFIEHFTLGEMEIMMRDWCRVLKPGGILSSKLPDGETIMQRLLSGDVHPDTIGCVFGKVDVNTWVHKMIWTPKLLESFVAQRGFKTIEVTKINTNCTIPCLKLKAIK